MRVVHDFERVQVWSTPLLLIGVVLAGDQVSKRWIEQTLGPEPYQRGLSLAGDWLVLTYARNTGIAFGLLKHLPQLFTFTSVLITGILIYAYVVHLPHRQRIIQTAFGLIVGGALGNILDRLRLGYVVDFVGIGWWPLFNLADSAITVGVLILATYLIMSDPHPPSLPPPRDDDLLHELLSRPAGD
jgi:signal peptidase II